jgi:pyrimidine operon attenuation protein/uracil phosphoribosyltransferase
MMDTPKLDLFPEGKLEITLLRLCHQLIENYADFQHTVLLGAQPRGVFLAHRIHRLLSELVPGANILLGELDATFFRDDFRMHDRPLQANRTRIDFLIEDKRVILIDDVLYTGRTIRAALDAMLAYGRPRSVELLVLVDRKHKRQLPIEPAYTGIKVDTIESEKVLVKLRESGGEDKVFLVSREDL